MTPTVDIRYANPGKGIAEIDVYPQPGAAAHHIAYLKTQSWWCATCDAYPGKGAGRRCPYIHTAREHPDTPDMEGK